MLKSKFRFSELTFRHFSVNQTFTLQRREAPPWSRVTPAGKSGAKQARAQNLVPSEPKTTYLWSRGCFLKITIFAEIKMLPESVFTEVEIDVWKAAKNEK